MSIPLWLPERVRNMLKVMILVLGLGLISPFSGSLKDTSVSNISTTGNIENAVLKAPVASPINQTLTSGESFETLNGISLLDQTEDVIHTKGKPLQVNEVPFLECTDYEYADSTVGICDGWVNYVHIDPKVGTFRVNEMDITINENQISEALGTPQFHAEDGEVYIRGDQAIKVYKDSSTGIIQGIDFFNDTSF